MWNMMKDVIVTSICYVIMPCSLWILRLYSHLATSGDCHVTHKGYINERITAAAFIPLPAFEKNRRESNCETNLELVGGLPRKRGLPR